MNAYVNQLLVDQTFLLKEKGGGGEEEEKRNLSFLFAMLFA